MSVVMEDFVPHTMDVVDGDLEYQVWVTGPEQWEQELLPPWAEGKTKELCLGCQLPTRDGRLTGNAVIFDIEEKNTKIEGLSTEALVYINTLAGTWGLRDKTYPPNLWDIYKLNNNGNQASWQYMGSHLVNTSTKKENCS